LLTGVSATRKTKMAKRIVSFLPSSTEILYELGLETQITGVTHECKYPDSAKEKPRVVRASFDASTMSSSEIDNKIAEIGKTGGDVYVLNDEVLKEAKPDVILAQGVCKVCAPHTKEIERAADILGYRPEVIVLDPHDLDDVLVSVLRIAEQVDKPKEGHLMVAKLRQRIDRVIARSAEKMGTRLDRPKMLCLEWIDPFYVAGHWIPQMVEIAGGLNGISSRGEPSRRIGMDEISQYRPDKIVVMPCGFDVERTATEMEVLRDNHKWKALDAVKADEVYAVNSNAYFSRPGPRTVVGLEILAKIINPAAFEDLELPSDSYKRLTF
jgi:iron complex transport system substrate-binding protein